MRYLQLLLFFAVVIMSYHFMGSPLPRVASQLAPTDVEAPVDEPAADTEAVPTEIPNE